MKILSRLAVVCTTALAVVAVSATPANAAVSYKNCTALQKTYPHGLGKKHAHDKTTGTPVTNFKHSTKKYKKAMNSNSDLDRDKDGIACEKK
jgi:hypothetical protein